MKGVRRMTTNNSLPELDLERIRNYNTELKKYTDQVATLKAEQTYIKSDLEKLCEELSAELGITITPDNVEQVYRERVAKIENTLKIGEEILGRIKAEEAEQANSGNVSSYTGTTPTPTSAAGQAMNPAVNQPVPGYNPAQNVGFAGNTPSASTPENPVNPTVQQNNNDIFATLPNMFGKSDIEI